MRHGYFQAQGALALAKFVVGRRRPTGSLHQQRNGTYLLGDLRSCHRHACCTSSRGLLLVKIPACGFCPAEEPRSRGLGAGGHHSNDSTQHTARECGYTASRSSTYRADTASFKRSEHTGVLRSLDLYCRKPAPLGLLNQSSCPAT